MGAHSLQRQGFSNPSRGSGASAWGACRLGVSPTWFSVNCSPGFGFHNLEMLPSAARMSSRARNRMSVADDILPTSATTWWTRGWPDWTSWSFSRPHISRKAGQRCSFPWVPGPSHPPPTSRPISKSASALAALDSSSSAHRPLWSLCKGSLPLMPPTPPAGSSPHRSSLKYP